MYMPEYGNIIFIPYCLLLLKNLGFIVKNCIGKYNFSIS